MKFAIDAIRRNAELRDSKIAALETYASLTSLTECLKSILYQLLPYLPDSLAGVIAAFRSHSQSSGGYGRGWTWEMNELRGILLKALSQEHRDFPIFLFIDAQGSATLQGSQAELWQLVHELLENAIASNLPFKVFLVSRNTPPSGGILWTLHIAIQTENHGDIEAYSNQRIGQLDPANAEVIGWHVRQQAQGVFQWAVLVVSNLCLMIENGPRSIKFCNISARHRKLCPSYATAQSCHNHRPSTTVRAVRLKKSTSILVQRKKTKRKRRRFNTVAPLCLCPVSTLSRALLLRPVLREMTRHASRHRRGIQSQPTSQLEEYQPNWIQGERMMLLHQNFQPKPTFRWGQLVHHAVQHIQGGHLICHTLQHLQ